MNDKSHACDCPKDMPTQQCIRYCTGECDGPSDTPANATSSESSAKPNDGITGDVTKLICHPATAPYHPETVGERLKRIYPEHYVSILNRMNAERGPQATAMVLSDLADDGIYKGYTLSAVFLWDTTPEGHEFWKALAKREGS